MRKLFVSALAAAVAIGSLVPLAEAAPIGAAVPVAGKGDIVDVKFFRCAVGRHRGPLGYCRPDTARPLFIFRRPCAPGRHRNVFGRCVPNLLR